MELIGINPEKNNKKQKRIMIWIGIAIILLFIVSIILYITIYYMEKEQFKFLVNGEKVQVDTDLFIFEGNTIYVSLRDISSIIDYKYYNGAYKQYSEDDTKCYLESDNEVCTFEKDLDKIYKTPVGKLDYEYFTIDKPIKKMNNGKLYISSEGLSLACNLKFYYEAEENKITIYTLPYYANYYTKNYKNAAVADNLKNQKALLYNLLVVQNVDNTENTSNRKDVRYGIHTLDGKEIVGTKYTAIEFIESTKEFIVRTEENKVGIITLEGKTKVKPQYDDLKQIDKDLNLYLATNNNKKGVIEKNGKILIYLEYDEIGIDTTRFPNNDIKNSYLLFENAIPVKQNGKWGMYDKKGKLILPMEYDGIGCVASDKNLNSILVIPDIQAIVVSKIYEMENNKKTTLYGIINAVGEVKVPAALTTVYSVTNNGREEYVMIHNNISYDVIEYINELEKLNKSTTSQNVQANEATTSQNVQANEVTTSHNLQTNEVTSNTVDGNRINTEITNQI